MTPPCGLCRGTRRRDQPDSPLGAAQRSGLVHRARRHRPAGTQRQRAAATSRTCGAIPAPSWTSSRRRPAPAGPRSTANRTFPGHPAEGWRSTSSTTPNPPGCPLPAWVHEYNLHRPLPQPSVSTDHPVDQPGWTSQLAANPEAARPGPGVDERIDHREVTLRGGRPHRGTSRPADYQELGL